LFQKYIYSSRNIRQEAIISIPFITQIYPSKVDQDGIHTPIIGHTISLNFIIPKG